MVFDSLAINLIMLIPTFVFAIFVEKHYTAFWTGFWNLFALGVTGFAVMNTPIIDSLNILGFPLGWFLIIVGFGLMIMSFFAAPIARIIGSSHITASLLTASYLFQYTSNPDIFWIAFFGSLIGIFIVKNFLF